jgi:hypothetical protein
MATTTNYGWETPDDTDLVKDGAAAIRTLGSSIDTSFVDLKGGTTGQVLSKTTNTDLDFTWIAAAQPLTLQTYTPTYTNLTLGNGTVTARYAESGDFVWIYVLLVWGSTTSITGAIEISTPVNLKTDGPGSNYFQPPQIGRYSDVSATIDYTMGIAAGATNRLRPYMLRASGTYVDNNNAFLNATLPFAYAPGDELFISGFWRKA